MTNLKILLQFILRRNTGRCKTGIQITASQIIWKLIMTGRKACGNTIFREFDPGSG